MRENLPVEQGSKIVKLIIKDSSDFDNGENSHENAENDIKRVNALPMDRVSERQPLKHHILVYQFILFEDMTLVNDSGT